MKSSKSNLISGKIIAVVGAPGCGKSTLVQKLAKYYSGNCILEGEEKDLPKRIIEDITKRHRNMELFLWWRNKNIKEFIIAEKYSSLGHPVFMDCFWMNNEAYIRPLFSGFERQILEEVSYFDKHFLKFPDLIIVLSASENKTKEFISLRDRNFDKSKGFMTFTNNLRKEHKRLFKKTNNTVFIDRTNLDFNNKKDFDSIIKRIENLL